MRNNSALQNVTLRTKSENFSYTHIQYLNIFSLLLLPQLVFLLPFLFCSSSFSVCYSPLPQNVLFFIIKLFSLLPPICFIFLLNMLFWLSSYYSSSSYISFPCHSRSLSFSPLPATYFLFHSSRNARASKFSHLPFRQLPTVPAGIPP